MMKIVISIIFLLSQVSYADTCNKDVEYLSKGSTTNCSGYLFSPKKEYEVRLSTETSKHLEEYVAKQNDLIEVMNSRIGNLKDYNNELNNQLRKNKELDFWKATLYFVLGATITGVVAKNVNN